MEEQLTAADLEPLDPTPDIHALFAYYNELYFNGKLGACSVEWSTKRMTMCAGICCYSRTSGCRIKLSEPLLKFRPTKDLKETLLHEMIHAELFLDGVKNDGDHGPIFRSRMTAINTATFTDHQRPAGGYHITVYHTMHDEVNLYRTHVWSCDRCGNTVKRSMNRPPQEADCRSFTKVAAAAAVAQGQPGSYCKDTRCWYHLHVKHCGGSYIKISEPEKPAAAANKAAAASSAAQRQPSSSAGSNKRPKQPTAAAAAGMHPIEAFFKRQDSQQQQQQQQESAAVRDGERPGQQHSRELSVQQEGQQQQQQQQQHRVHQQDQQQQQQQPQQQQQSSGDYWSSLGAGRTLAGSAGQLPVLKSGTPGQSASSVTTTPAAAAAAAAKGQHSAAAERLQGIGDNARAERSDADQPQQQQQQPQPQRLPLQDLWLAQNRQHQQQQQFLTQQGHGKQSVLLTPQDRQQQQQQQQERHRVAAAARSLQEAVDVVELLSSDDEDEAAAAAAAAAGVCRSVGAGAGSTSERVVGLPSSPSLLGGVDAAGVGPGRAGGGGGAAALMCPVCCQEWAPGEISNVLLNAHLDECLARMH